MTIGIVLLAAVPLPSGAAAGVRGAVGPVCVSGPIGLGEAGAPWWAVLALIVFLSVVALSAICVQTLIPQNSRDRLAWWRDRRRCQTMPQRRKRGAGRAHELPGTAG
jgi:hypothetical protein